MKLPKINSKADAMAYAIEKADGDLERAEKIYRLFADNMELPDTEIMGKGSVFSALTSHVLPTILKDIKGKSEQEIPLKTAETPVPMLTAEQLLQIIDKKIKGESEQEIPVSGI